MGKPPQVSVVLACDNEEATLEASFGEIRKRGRGGAVPNEIILVDDVSRDGTRAIIAATVATTPRLVRKILHETKPRPRRHGQRRIPRRARRDRRLPRRRPRGALPLHPSQVRAIQQGWDGATVQRIYAFQLRSARPPPAEPRLPVVVAPVPAHAVPRHRDRLQVLPRARRCCRCWTRRGPGLVLGHRDHGPRECRGMRSVEIPGAYVRRHDKTSTVSGLQDSLALLQAAAELPRPSCARGP